MTIRILSNNKEHITLITDGYRQQIPERDCVVFDTLENVLDELIDDGYWVIKTIGHIQ